MPKTKLLNCAKGAGSLVDLAPTLPKRRPIKSRLAEKSAMELYAEALREIAKSHLLLAGADDAKDHD